MIYEKRFKGRSFGRRKIEIGDFKGGVNGETDESLLSSRYSSLSYNMKFSSGALAHSGGYKKLTLNTWLVENMVVTMPNGVVPLKAYYFRKYNEVIKKFDDRLLIYAHNKFLYDISLINGESKKIESLVFETAPSIVNYRYNSVDVALISSETEMLAIYDGENIPQKIPTAPKITSMCIHYERLFATTTGDKSLLWFSDDFDPTNWNVNLDSAGFIQMVDSKGALLKVISFLDYVYIFRTYGISRLSAFSNQENFSVTELFATSGKIYSDTVTICGNKVMFLAEDGLYVFDGLYTRKVANKLDYFINNIDNKNAMASYKDGIYYLALNIKIENAVMPCIIKYNILEGTFIIEYGLDTVSMCVINGESMSKIVFIFRGSASISEECEESLLMGNPRKKLWQSGQNDLGIPAKIKNIRKLELFSEDDLTVEIESESGKRTFFLTAKNNIVSCKPNLKGNLFKIKFISETPTCRIVKPILTVDVFD